MLSNWKWMLPIVAVAMSATLAEARPRARCCRVWRCPQPCVTACTPCGGVVCGDACGDGGAACGPQYTTVERTVMVPELVTEVRKVTVTEYTQEQRERKYVVQRQVPRVEVRNRVVNYTVMEPRVREEAYTVYETAHEQVDQEYTVMVPYQVEKQGTRPVWDTVEEERTAEYTVMVPYTEKRQGTRPVWDTVVEKVEQTYTVMVPYTVEKQGMRPVWDTVHETAYRTVQRVTGHWVTEEVADPCNPCCVRTCRKWCPQVCCEQVPYTVCRRVCRMEPYNYTVTLCRPEQRTRWVEVCRQVCRHEPYEYDVTVCRPEVRVRKWVECRRVCRMEPYNYTVTLCRPEVRVRKVDVCRQVPVQKVRQVKYCECVQKQREETYNVTVYDCVEEEQVQVYTVCVPHQVEREVQVQVCRMVPKVVSVQVPCGNYGAACGNCPSCCN